VIAGVIVLFVIGDMVWIPTSQALAADLAPSAVRGTYFGAMAAMTGPAWTLVPFLALQIRAGVGVSAVWLFFGAAAIGGAAVGIAAARASSHPVEAAPGPELRRHREVRVLPGERRWQ
jgi:hypothetical protein